LKAVYKFKIIIYIKNKFNNIRKYPKYGIIDKSQKIVLNIVFIILILFNFAGLIVKSTDLNLLKNPVFSLVISGYM
jgi:hypothetical protein